ncbi:PAS domain-containing protein [Sporosarcina thermotolerans]|uniref:PAS domain-containing protein n=1 Tax=Sporosarcina thermotolerans TaxID=633404 RepID=UPI003D2F87B1
MANCHPPKSLRKVMTVIRDLKTGIRTSESMWFKKKDQYIHLTYKAIFNKEGEFLGYWNMSKIFSISSNCQAR